MSAGPDDTTTSGPPSGGRPPDTAAEGDPGILGHGGGSSATNSTLLHTSPGATVPEQQLPELAEREGLQHREAASPEHTSSLTTATGSQPNAASTGHPSPQTTGSQPNAASSTGHLAPETTATGSQPNAASSTGHLAPETTATGSQPNAASSTGHPSPQTTGSQPNAASSTGHPSPQTTAAGSQPVTASTGHMSPQTTGSQPVTASTGHMSPQTTTTGSQPVTASTGHMSPQTTGSQPVTASTGHMSPQTTTTGSQPVTASTGGHPSPQTTTMGSQPVTASTGHPSPQTTTTGSQPVTASTGHPSPQTTTMGSQPVTASTGHPSPQTTTTGSQPVTASTGHPSPQTTTMGSQPVTASTGHMPPQTTGSPPNAASSTGHMPQQTSASELQPGASSSPGLASSQTSATGEPVSNPSSAGCHTGLGLEQDGVNKPGMGAVHGNKTRANTYPAGRGRRLPLVEDHFSEAQLSVSAAGGGSKLTDHSQSERADSQRHTKKTGDPADDLSERFLQLNIGMSHRLGEHQRGSNDSADIATESHTTSQQLPGSSSIQPQVHTFAAGKKGTESFSAQKEGVNNTGCDQKGSRSHGTHASAGPQKDKTPDEQSMLPASMMYVQKQKKDSLETVSIVFETATQGKRYTTMYPQAIDVPKWKLMKNNGIEDLLSMTGDEKRKVVIEENLGKVVVTWRRTVHPDEAHDWTKFCMQKVSECLERIQSVMFTRTDIMKYLPFTSDAQLAEFYCQLDSDKRWLTVFAINSEAMDKFMERVVPLLNQETNWKMLIKIPLHLQKLRMLEKLGFRRHYEQRVQGVKVSVNCKNSEYILDCLTDLRHSVESEIQAFVDSLERVVLDVPDLYKTYLFDGKSFFQQQMARQWLHFWVTEIQGAVEIWSPSRETLSRVKETVIKNMICITVFPLSPRDHQYYLTTMVYNSQFYHFCYRQGADGKSIELAGFREMVEDLLWKLHVTLGTPVTKMQAYIRTDISEKLSRQALSGSTGGPSRKSKCLGDGDRQSREQERTTRAANQPGEEEQNGSRDRPSVQGDRPDSSVEPSRKQEQTGTGGDRQTRGQENVTHRPSKGIEKTDDRGSRSNYQEMPVYDTQAEGNRSSSLHTQPSQSMQVTADRKAQPPDRNAQIPEMSVPPAQGHAVAPQIPEMSVPPAQGHAMAPQGPAQRHPKAHTGNAGSMEMHKYHIPANVAQLLQVPDVIDKFKAKLMDKQCLVDCQSVSGGFIKIKEDSREEDVSSTIHELFHQEVIEVGEDDQDVEKALNSLREKYAGKVSYVSEEGRWNICVTADIKEDIHGEIEKLKQAQCLVPLPLYAAELLALDIDRVNGVIKQDVDSSVRVNITDDEGKQGGVELSSARKFIKQAVRWMHDFVLELEITNRALSVSEALSFQHLEGQNMIQKVEGGVFYRIDVVVDEDWSGLCATSPSGQRLLVCRDTMAATDCDCIVLPLWKGQTEWTPLQRWILRKSFLSENITSYQERCQENPMSLMGSADCEGKTIIIVPVPAWEDGAAKEKEKIISLYKQAFEMCGKNQHSVGVCAKQSPSIPFRKSLTPLLFAVWETFSTQDRSSTTCETVVMYTDSAQDAKVTCQAVTQSLPQGWRVKPPRAPRPRSGKGIIEVCLGEIQKTKADVIVNSTNRKLICDKGAVEKAIGEAAGPEMYKACRELYPQGIPENGLAVTNSFRMENAKRIYHIALSQDIFDEDRQRVLLYNLRQVILHCLVKASLEQHATIAFPTLGSGQLQYPCDVVARAMFSTIHTFFTEMPHTTLQKVIIVVFPKNLPAIQALKMEEISRLYTFSTEEKRATYEMQMNLTSHKIQVIHGNVFQKPWVSDVCVHGKLASERGESPSNVQGCRSIVVDTREDYRKYVRTALLRARTVQIAADTLRSETLTDLASALESVLSHDKQGHCLVSVVFSDEEKAMKFQQSFKDVECGHVVPGEEKRNHGQMFVCSYKGGEEIARKIEEFEVSPRYKELLKVYRESGADQAQKEGGKERGDKEPDKVSISLPKSFLENVDLAQILKVQFTPAEREGMTNISVRLADLVNTAKALTEGIGNKPFEKESCGSEKVSGPGEESKSTDGWEINLDEFQVEALKYLLREEFDQTFDMKKNQDGVLLTFKGASSRALEKQVDSLRREDVQLNPEEVAKLEDNVDVRSEGVEAFVRTVRNMDKATVFAFDYNAMSKAKHLVYVKAGRVKVTARGRRRFETGNSGPPDQATPQTGDMSHGAGSDVQTKTFTTPSGVTVSVYKTDITKLPVDAIVNAANEQLAHGGGVAYVISEAAGFALEEEGREHLRKHGDLKVTEVVATTAGSLPCQKVLHAVGPRWFSYQDKAQCQQLLVDTVFNCLHKAHSLGFTSLALPSISAAIFGVPQPICAQSYLSAVKKFDAIQGHSTPLKEIHFVDINDGMISVIQSTFSADWSVPASSTPGNQGVEAAAGVRNRQEESSRPVHSLPADSQEKRLDMLSKEGPRPRQGPESGNQGQPPGHTAGLQDEPAGFPCLTEWGPEKEYQVQVAFKDRDLTLIFQKQSVTDIVTESVILWQDVQKIMRDSIWKQFVKKLSPQAENKALELKKNMITADKTYTLKTVNKQFVFIVTSSSGSCGEEKIGDFVEQAFNKVDLDRKTTVAIPRKQKEEKGKPSNKDREETEVFISGLYRAVKSYAERANRSIREIHVGEPDLEILQFMGDKVKTLMGIDQSLLDQQKSQPSSSQSASPASGTAHSPDPCSICHGEPNNPKALTCGHVFCTSCIDQWFQTKPTCPTCNSIQGTVRGDQPEDGTMRMKYSSFIACDGFPQGMYTVDYWFPPGKQKENHPNPGMRYSSTARTAYLPDTLEGRKVLMLLKVAFDRRLIFTVGKSATSGSVGIIWNDIHHKTFRSGGAESHGYPDPRYLTRVQEELAAKGVTEKDLTNVQQDFIANPAKVHSLYRYDFSDYFGTPV